MGGEAKYEIHQNAYIKLVLHALKHQTSAVNGVLLGRLSAGNDDTVEIVESVPLFHSQIGLLPPLEIALIMIEEYYSDKGLSIVGYFHANERFDDFELGTVAKNIGDQISKYFPVAALLLLDNKKLEALSKGKDRSPVMQLYTKDASRNYIASEKWKDITDFDDHLDDISKDWLNPELFK
ncbi:OLC1v1022444C1 [Oldenlandia corymbosa var. corymbosa]|uniref:OLC1v1022444C1 n=1 Tax=Oldenlandia corymbosa var. corymbosa TaxID=529605 RepID=A0AAV1C085_OLDCO|nr:OLC1v1022444C1 [Oldenlandia corymbosa var. corymbosa]